METLAATPSSRRLAQLRPKSQPGRPFWPSRPSGRRGGVSRVTRAMACPGSMVRPASPSSAAPLRPSQAHGGPVDANADGSAESSAADPSMREGAPRCVRPVLYLPSHPLHTVPLPRCARTPNPIFISTFFSRHRSADDGSLLPTPLAAPVPSLMCVTASWTCVCAGGVSVPTDVREESHARYAPERTLKRRRPSVQSSG